MEKKENMKNEVKQGTPEFPQNPSTGVILGNLSSPTFHASLGIETNWRIGDRAGSKNGVDRYVIYPYYEATQCREILDAVFGVAGWNNEYREVCGHLFCVISTYIDGVLVEKMDAGGSREALKDLKEADKNTFAAKTAASSAFVRASRAWGIGRHHEYLPQVILSAGPAKGQVVTPSGEVLSTQVELKAYCNASNTSLGYLASIYRGNQQVIDASPELLHAMKIIKEAIS